MTLADKQDAQRPHADVTVGSTWFAWGYHWRITEERDANGVREVRMVNTNKRATACWIPAWRVLKYGRMSEAC